jgi:predicted regulator of Ras-like GTPase activity (Roadblock/LC7/MglB family)
MRTAHRARLLTSTLAMALMLVGASGCGGGAPAVAPSSTLPTGKDDLALTAGRYRSPTGFEPAVVVTVGDGWTSVHRGDDGFDLGRSTTDDGLLIAVAFLVPSEATAADTLDAVRAAATSTATQVTVTIGGAEANGLDVDGGSGQLIASAAAGIALDAAPDGRVRVLALDVDEGPLAVAILVPDLSRWDEVWPDVEAILETAEFG